ncbi:hypothetical protein [Amycolatopsis sp. NPDC059657]|uniref:hypothetical protein n=1 Tax=Amycolatopsis sp. NPDC059657 TaxID=3346899 RepID=UPI0036706A68
MKNFLTPAITLGAAVLLSVAAATPAPAAVAAHGFNGFVLVSNRSGGSQMACVTSTDVANKNPAVSAPFCRWIKSKGTAVWTFSSAAVQSIEVRDTGGKHRSFFINTDASHCYRYSASGSFHEATDKPCTRS